MSSFCVICGDRGIDAAVFGVYTTVLCLVHGNKLEELVIKRGWLRKLHLLEKRRDALVIGYRGLEYQMRELLKATSTTDLYKDKLYYTIKEWVSSERSNR